MVNIEKKTKWILTAVLLVGFLGLVFTSYGRSSWALVTFGILSILYGLFLWGEGGWVNYLIKKGYRTWSKDDFLVIGSFIFGTVLLINGILITWRVLSGSSPGWLTGFIAPVSSISALVGFILAVWFFWSPKPKPNE